MLYCCKTNDEWFLAIKVPANNYDKYASPEVLVWSEYKTTAHRGYVGSEDICLALGREGRWILASVDKPDSADFFTAGINHLEADGTHHHKIEVHDRDPVKATLIAKEIISLLDGSGSYGR